MNYSFNDEFKSSWIKKPEPYSVGAHADISTYELSLSTSSTQCLTVILFQPHNHFICFKYVQDN